MTIKIQGDKITFPDDSEQTTAYDGSSASIWTEFTDPTLVAPEATYDGNIVVRNVNIGTGANGKGSNAVLGRNATGSNKNVTGYNNVAIGDDSFASMSTANNSVAVGYHAIELNTTGNGNVAVGCLLYTSPSPRDS